MDTNIMPQMEPEKKSGHLVYRIILWSLAGVALLGAGTALGLYLSESNKTLPVFESYSHQVANQVETITTTYPDVTEEVSATSSPVVQEFMTAFAEVKDSQKSSSTFVYTRLPSEIVNKIVWIDPVKLPGLGLFGKLPTISEDDSANTQDAYFLKGNFVFNEKPGYVIFADASCNTLGCDYSGPVMMFVLYDRKLTAVSKLSDDFLYDPYLLKNKIYVDKYLDIAGLHFPGKISGPKPRQILSYYSVSPINISVKVVAGTNNEISKEFTIAGLGDVVKMSNPLPSYPTGFDGNKNDFYILGPDLRYRTYTFEPDFLAENRAPLITWSDGTKNDKSYSFETYGGCGRHPVDVIEGLSVESDLVKAGTNSKGDAVYFLKDGQHKLLKDIYENVQPGEDGTKISYADFIKQKPAFFWVDPFGRLIMFTSDRFVPPAECGKPVIYLYPEKTTKVSVKIDLSKLTYSEPEYAGGWEVVAEPSGQLTEVKSGLEYPYLFWEGLGVGQYDTPEKGFVVAREKTSEFLSQKLGALGLNGKEISDFKEYWLPKMIKSPYYFVTFLGTSGMNQLAPLHISPKPDTMIRVLMDYKPLANPIQVVEPVLRAPQRRGFTVVEWGGVLGRE